MKIVPCAAVVAFLLQPAALVAQKASVAGVVLNADGDPIPNMRVAIGKLGVDLGPLPRLLGQETTLSTESLAQVVAMVSGPQGIAADPAQAAAAKSIPVDEIYEITVSPIAAPSVVYKSTPPVMTDERGRFSFAGLDAGSYRLTVSGNGYVKQNHGQTLTSGQSKTDIAVRMVKLGAISGLVRDSAGQPVTGVEVEAFRVTYDQTGQKKNQPVAIMRTDDLGEYRLYALLPGRYYVTAGGHAGRPETGARLPPGLLDRVYGGGYATANRIPQYYTQMYYPAAANQSSAMAIDVQSGADVRGVDLLVSLLPPYRVRGRVVDPKTGHPPQRVTFQLTYQDPGGKGSVDLLSGINPNYKSTDGSFEIQNVSAGAYFLAVGILDAAPQAIPLAWLPLNVTGDVEGIVLSLAAGGSLNGRLRVESNEPVSAELLFNLASVQPLPRRIGPELAPIVEGKFHIDNVPPGEYRVSIGRMPEGFYVKEARLGEIDVLNAPLRYRPGDTAILDVLISSRVGSIDGVTSPGAQVVLIPNESRERTELFRTVTADPSGRFRIPSVAPGEYTLAAWEVLEPYAFFDPAVMRQAEEQGKAVRVGESSNQKVDIPGIPAR